MAYDNNKQRQSESLHLVLKGIKDALGGLNENLTMTPEGEDESTPVLPAMASALDSIATSIASALDSIATSLATIAERLNPLYMADYVEPEPDPDPDPDPEPEPSDDTEPGGE